MSINRPSGTVISDEVYRKVRGRIVRGELRPGSRLVQRQLAAEYNTSGSPIIECIRRLERDGLVESTPGSGAEVREFTQHDMVFICKLRACVESTSAAWFALNASRIQRMELEKLGQRCNDAWLAGDETGYGEADIALHTHMAECSVSPLLLHFVEKSYIISATVLNRFPNDLDWPAGVELGAHDDLIAAANSGDPKRAEKAALEHLGGVRKYAEAVGLSYLTDVL